MTVAAIVGSAGLAPVMAAVERGGTIALANKEALVSAGEVMTAAVAPLTEKDYYVRGCTALLYAIGYGMEKMVNIQRHLPEDERAEKVIFVITTDGLENASKRFSYEKIRRMIEREKEQYGWEFLFLGANMDAVKEAARFGIGADRAVRFENDAQGLAVNYHVVSETVSRMREAPCCASIGAEWKEQIEADFQKRHHG